MTDSEQCSSCSKHLPGGGGASRGGWVRVGGVGGTMTFSFLWTTCYILMITFLKRMEVLHLLSESLLFLEE